MKALRALPSVDQFLLSEPGRALIAQHGRTEVLAALRARPDAPPVIMITAEADRSKLEALVAIGVQGYILKPFKPEALRKALLALHARLKNTPA